MNAHEVNQVPWSLWITVSSGVGLRPSIAIPKALVTIDAAGRESTGPTHDATAEGVQHHSAMDLAFAGGVLGDVGHPQPVRR